MSDADRSWSRWLVRLLSWDGLLPLGCWGVIWVVHQVFLQRRGIVELTAIVLPTAAFIVRMVVGWRSFRVGAPPEWARSGHFLLKFLGGWVITLRLVLFFLGLATLAFLDAMVALRPLIPGMAQNPVAFQINFVVFYGIYFLCMAVVTLPVLQPGADVERRSPWLTKTAPVATALVTAARAGRLRPVDWRHWAESAFSTGKLQESWLPLVAQAQTEEELYRAALPRVFAERAEESLLIQATLGHLWERCRKGELSLAEFLHQAAELCYYEWVLFSHEEFDALAQMLERSGPRYVEKELKRMLEFPVQLAQKYWNLLRRFADVLP